ncbi:MAG TPA: hypothetical protein VJ353_17110, partial [Xanthobacteraceae bacterium]|nr:hypothetical protein [Xanthobacteraceae bacterium]
LLRLVDGGTPLVVNPSGGKEHPRRTPQQSGALPGRDRHKSPGQSELVTFPDLRRSAIALHRREKLYVGS